MSKKMPPDQHAYLASLYRFLFRTEQKSVERKVILNESQPAN
jgi:hypothetical protein